MQAPENHPILWIALAILVSPPMLQGDVFVDFDAAVGELPEGVAVSPTGTVYVSIAPLGQVRRVTPDGTQTVMATLDPAPQGFGALGLTVDSRGDVYAALASFNPTTHGVWRIAPDGSATERLPGSEQIGIPNSLAFGGDGVLYVTDTAGAVWRIPPRRAAEPWASGPELQGTGELQGVPLGANGIAYRARHVYVTNTDKGFLVRIPVLPNGGAGTPEILSDDPRIFPPDGLAVDARGDFYVPVIGQNTLVRVSGDGGEIETLATAADDLYLPASVALTRDGRTAYVTNFAFAPPPEPAIVGAAIIRISLGPLATAATTCAPAATTLCLQSGRFAAQLDWAPPGTGLRPASAAPATGDDSGLFYFFDPDNAEILVKVLDGCLLTGTHWVFAAAATDLEFTLRVTDTMTGQTRRYHNPPGNAAAAITDTAAFATCP